MKIQFVGAIGLITRDRAAGRKFYAKTLGLPLEQPEGGDFLFSRKLGSRYFGVWPLSGAARTCFGTDSWPTDRPIPQVFVEFELSSPASVANAATELESRGHALLHGPRKDPWGQTVARLQADDGVLIGLSYVPWMHRRTKPKTKYSGSLNRG